MRVLVLHSDISPDAPPDELDTLIQAEAVAVALAEKGHHAERAPFAPSTLRMLLERVRPDAVFNLVESVEGAGERAPLAPEMLAQLGTKFTGNASEPMTRTGNKPLVKRIFRDAGHPTPDWTEPPHWHALAEHGRYVVKSATEDASLGLDDEAVVIGCAAVRARAQLCRERFGGRWFAEEYIEGREFNVAVLEEDGAPRVLPIAEMRFEQWEKQRPRIVGYGAKWDTESPDAVNTVRVFGWDETEPELNARLSHLAREAWHLFGLSGYARVDFRVSERGEATMLEINPNPCIAPDAGFAAAAAQAGFSYADMVEKILASARVRT
ncbi:MAG TPA: ATP-grasp domain-containing protein [Rhizomicrobium sp.]|jgi:D-alanine-D-alanine ligase|nr:ATP-grasp domain-containing protein [Rhizomicrobium sp.]